LCEFDELTTAELREFSADAYLCAKKHKTISLPCGLFESVWCYAVAIAKFVDEETLDSIRDTAETLGIGRDSCRIRPRPGKVVLLRENTDLVQCSRRRVSQVHR
jgi:hypothetical protein